uniref:PRO1495 n=1 Tax=Homo sapiens TaxID=9606 RepID=Q9H371_HUMAN|nr:PRO1495 [Homo sapiens]
MIRLLHIIYMYKISHVFHNLYTQERISRIRVLFKITIPWRFKYVGCLIVKSHHPSESLLTVGSILNSLVRLQRS